MNIDKNMTLVVVVMVMKFYVKKKEDVSINIQVIETTQVHRVNHIKEVNLKITLFIYYIIIYIVYINFFTLYISRS